MADAFATLWNSSIPAKSDSPQKLGSQPANVSVNARRPTQDTFSILAASSAPSSRPLTPSTAGKKISTKPSAPSGDAFSDLLSNTLGGTSTQNNGANLTIAERAARAEREKLQRQQQSAKAQSLTWDGLDSLANPSLVKQSSSHPPDDWEFGFADPPKPASKVSVAEALPPQEDDWGLSEFSSNPTMSISASPVSRHQDILDLDDISVLAAPVPRAVPTNASQFDSLGEFSSFDQDPLLDNESHNDDDILGILSKPVDAIPRQDSLATVSLRSTT